MMQIIISELATVDSKKEEEDPTIEDLKNK